jgi:DNA-binding transcriptional LysR family regulator
VQSAEPDIEKSDTPVQEVNTQTAHRLPESARWDDLRVAMALHEWGSFRRSAERLGVTINTVRARLDRLEGAVGQRLFRRSPQGVSATPAGLELIGAALRMQQTATLEPGDASSLLVPGEISIGTSEGLGLVWLTPELPALQEQLDGMTVNLQCRYALKGEQARDVDIEIGYYRSTDPTMVSARIATIHFMLFASRGYIARRGAPASLADLVRHRFIELVSPGVNSHILDFWVGADPPRDFIPIRTNSSMTLLWAVMNGEGVAALPTYSVRLSEDLVPLDLPVQLRFDLFLTYHPDLRGSPAAMTATRWAKEIFAAGGQPWFREHFVHPDRFRAEGWLPGPSQPMMDFMDEAIR